MVADLTTCLFMTIEYNNVLPDIHISNSISCVAFRHLKKLSTPLLLVSYFRCKCSHKHIYSFCLWFYRTLWKRTWRYSKKTWGTCKRIRSTERSKKCPTSTTWRNTSTKSAKRFDSWKASATRMPTSSTPSPSIILLTTKSLTRWTIAI